MTLLKRHEANSSQAFNDPQVISHMHIYSYWYRATEKEEPKGVCPGKHSSVFRYDQQNTPPQYVYPEME